MSTDEDNPFLIVPPPGLLPKPDSRQTESTPPLDADDPEEFITLPPGFADSATHRVVRPVADVQPKPAPVDEIVFFPVLPGVPPIPPVVAVSPDAPSASSGGDLSGPDTPPVSVADAVPVAIPVADADAVPIADALDAETRLSTPRRETSVWQLSLPGNEAVSIAGAVIIGRDPVRTDRWPDAQLLPVADPAKSVSKTHAMFEIDGGRLWVHDLDSTNGVFVAAPGLEVIQVDPGSRALVPDGAEIELGEYIVTASRP